MNRFMASGRRIACVTLDVTGTILGFERRVGEMYAWAAKQSGLDPPDASEVYESFKRSYASVNEKHPFVGGLSMSTKQWWEKVVNGAFEGVGCSYGKEDMKRVFELLYREYGSIKSFKLFEDTVPFLKTAKDDGLMLGVISNQSERYSDEIFPQFKISQYFDFMVFGKHALAAKPSREIFQVAINAAGLKPNEMLHIGDDKQKDFDGALSSGMHALLLDRSRRDASVDKCSVRTPIFKDLTTAYEHIRKL
mmetsp:Transcript_9124/g.27455  ORF Transcript_9124/g.27455 Transcript_9124/m.27455 type:complete len:250 (-) Transcript_9124:288-1037(-)|eukprot:CAMPEP_0198730340 /NCGR_PEP_ID=MMETSP1475-20131203/24101_1 /TAXON_ID= ORGANISM="Unidentified sp., Strain CCMP1999" /NCGR_SAMPLE_ID=MMETSP1475 /ASSEMBLY_ACC=CAM_ASM_001111 /LENGTH=249 /DNA_ID=CAMNT_0044493131 /DNA_START=56 /DNA_END=805 /DNA_ORIENTATION=-